MVAKIKSGKSLIGALNYNETKVRNGKAQLIEASGYFKDMQDLKFNDKLFRLADLAAGNERTKTNAVHISLNFATGEKLQKELLQQIYIRDRKTVARMATHEQEIVPIYSNLGKRTTITKNQQVAKVFAFPRFSLSKDQALNVELYERNGNRHLYLQIRQNDLDDIQTLNPVKQQPDSSLAANTL